MAPPPPRRALCLLGCALLLPSCWYLDSLPTSTGDCRGTFQGRSVRGAIAEHSALRHLDLATDGSADSVLELDYDWEDVPDLEGFGVDIRLGEAARVDAQRTVALAPEGSRLVPVERSLVREWVGHIGGAVGYLSVPGVPQEASVTLDAVRSTSANGRFTYRFSDASALTCTFDVIVKDAREDD